MSIAYIADNELGSSVRTKLNTLIDLAGDIPAIGDGDLLVGDGVTGSTNEWVALPDVATGNVLLSGGVGDHPAYGKVGLTTHITGTLGVGNGGTGTPTEFTTKSVVFAGASGVYSQDNAEFAWDDGAKVLKAGGMTIGDTGLLADTNNTYDLGDTTNKLKNLYLAGSIGIGAAPTARLLLPAGAAGASAAPLKFTSGTVQGTPETGAMEYDGTNLTFVRTGTDRETVVMGTIDSADYLLFNIEGSLYRVLVEAVT